MIQPQYIVCCYNNLKTHCEIHKSSIYNKFLYTGTKLLSNQNFVQFVDSGLESYIYIDQSVNVNCHALSVTCFMQIVNLPVSFVNAQGSCPSIN